MCVPCIFLGWPVAVAMFVSARAGVPLRLGGRWNPSRCCSPRRTSLAPTEDIRSRWPSSMFDGDKRRLINLRIGCRFSAR